MKQVWRDVQLPLGFKGLMHLTSRYIALQLEGCTRDGG
jgi:hypothetical protein